MSDGNWKYGHAADIDLFPAYAPAIQEDWNAIFGLRAKPVSALEWLRASTSLRGCLRRRISQCRQLVVGVL
jgi:hypothetical protein